MKTKQNRIIIISPVRDEEEYLEGTINSLINQTIKPIEWIVVDDGSTDRTAEIVQKAAQDHPWIHLVTKPDRGKRAVGPGVVEAFYFGYEKISSDNYDYICKMDGDIEFKPNYFERLLDFFDNDPFLGAASGKPFGEAKNNRLIEERHNDEMVAGMINFYRRKCFEDIGGFVREVHWDGITFHRARMYGWRTRSIRHPDLNFIHKRQMGSSYNGILTGRIRWGKGQYFMGTPVLYIFAIGFYRMLEKPFIIGGFFIVYGYFKSMIQKSTRYTDLDFRKSLNAWQMERLKLGKRLENIPDPNES